uniref:hypothetical protein n=1 Tax=Stella sp. TaxID=2912054 RepID=UPI0035B17C9E
MDGRRACCPTAAAFLAAALFALGACSRYEPIEVWDPENPQREEAREAPPAAAGEASPAVR